MLSPKVVHLGLIFISLKSLFKLFQMFCKSGEKFEGYFKKQEIDPSL